MLPLERATGTPYLPKGAVKEQRHGDIVLRVFGYEHGTLVAEIETDALTRSGLDSGCVHVAAQIDIDVAELVPLDRYGLDGALDAAAVVVAVLLPMDIDDAVALVQLPASLLEGEGLGFPNLAELGRMNLPLLLQAEEEELVALLDALCNVLERLRADFLQVGEPRKPLQLRQVLLEVEQVQVLVIQAVVPLVEGDAMIVRNSRRIDLLVELAVASRSEELELERLSHGCRLLSHLFYQKLLPAVANRPSSIACANSRDPPLIPRLKPWAFSADLSNIN